MLITQVRVVSVVDQGQWWQMWGELLDQILKCLRWLDQHFVDHGGRLLKLCYLFVPWVEHFVNHRVALVELVECFRDCWLLLGSSTHLPSELLKSLQHIIELILQQPFILDINLLGLFQLSLQVNQLPFSHEVSGHCLLIIQLVSRQLFELPLKGWQMVRQLMVVLFQ